MSVTVRWELVVSVESDMPSTRPPSSEPWKYAVVEKSIVNGTRGGAGCSGGVKAIWRRSG